MITTETVDYDALAATTSIEEITGNENSRDTLRSLKNDNLAALWLCASGFGGYDVGDYQPNSSEELGWLGHFTKKSARLEQFGMCGSNIFKKCSKQSIDRFFEDLGKCNHIKKMDFFDVDLAEFIGTLGPAIKNGNITNWDMNECYLGVPRVANHLFNTFRDMKSLKELSITYEDNRSWLEDDIMAECIPSLAACTVMQKLNLSWLGLGIYSCTALGAIFHRMANLQTMTLDGNSIDDNCVEVLVRGLAGCKYVHILNLARNRISDDGLEVLVEGLPLSVDALNLNDNEVTLARMLPLLRLKKLHLARNALSPDGPRVIAASLANPECCLEELYLNVTNIGDEGAATLASSLRSNQRLAKMLLEGTNITETGWNVFSSVLCDTTNINATHGLNHTLQSLGAFNIPQDVKTMLQLNSDQDKSCVAAAKILRNHRHLDMKPLFDRKLGLLPHVVAWLERFAESRLDLKMSSIFEFVRAMPMNVVDGVAGEKKGKKRMHNSI